MRQLLLLPALLLAASAHADQQPRKLDNFVGINVKGPINMQVDIGKAQSVTITGEKAFIDNVQTVVDGGVLRVSYDDKGPKNIKGESKIIITVPALTSFRVQGAGQADLNGVSGERIDISFEGAGALHANGKVKLLRLKAQGVGEVNTKELKTERADVNFNGMGDVAVHASHTLNLVVRGMGSLSYYGHPKTVNKSVGGFGSINAKD
jgi:hypothetical protein